MEPSHQASIREVVERLQQALDANRCTLYAVDSDKNEVRSLFASGMGDEEIRLPMNRGLVGYVARTGNPLNLKDVYNDPRFERRIDQETGYRTKSALTMAVRANGRIVGVLQALNAQSADRFDTKSEALMQETSVQLGEMWELSN